MKTRKLALNAVLAAMCAALGALALDLNSIKITFESFPVLLGALLFGPLDGLAVGFVGTLLYQLLRYGVSVTTPLWILPYALAGLMTGCYAKRRGFSLTTGQTVGIVVAAEVLVTALNTLAPAKLQVRSQLSAAGGRKVIRTTVRNVGRSVAFAVHVQPYRRSDGERILPYVADDNYFTLLQGESRQIDFEFDAGLLPDDRYTVRAEAYNR